jgi:hypothetical protein
MLPTLLILISGATCDPSGEPRPLSAEGRRNTYTLIRETCRSLGAADHVCEAAVAMAWRESRGRPTVTHTRGINEYGLGLFGHAPKFWGWLLRPAGLGDDAFCDPALATVALVREFQFAVRRGASTLRDLQRVHSGRSPRDESGPHKDNRWCHLLANGPRDDRGAVSWPSLDCSRAVTAEDLGPRITDERVRAEGAD